MSRDRFFEFQRCLHITNLATYEHTGREDVEYNKMKQVLWLVRKIQDACMSSWIFGKFLIMDEMMVGIKELIAHIVIYAKQIAKVRNKDLVFSQFYLKICL